MVLSLFANCILIFGLRASFEYGNILYPVARAFVNALDWVLNLLSFGATKKVIQRVPVEVYLASSFTNGYVKGLFLFKGYLLKPFFTCVYCMASVWGTAFLVLGHGFRSVVFNECAAWHFWSMDTIFWIVLVAGINFILGRTLDKIWD